MFVGQRQSPGAEPSVPNQAQPGIQLPAGNSVEGSPAPTDVASAPALGGVSHAHATSPPPVKLDVYEGPLDLLLDLIRKQEINIYDIPIAKITKQYLDYLRMLEEMNIDVAGDFVFMAATLIHIKSRMLLPAEPGVPAEDQEDPRIELVQRLLEHEQFKNAAQMLQSKRVLEEATWSQPGIGEFVEAEDEPALAVSVFDLISAFRQILERAKKKPAIDLQREEVSVKDMIEHAKRLLLVHPHSLRLEDLVEGFGTRQALIAMLIALLEMVRLRAVTLRQKEVFAPIVVHRSQRFEELMSGEGADLLQVAVEEWERSDIASAEPVNPDDPNVS